MTAVETGLRPSRPWWRAVPLVAWPLSILCVVIWVRTAWVADDAYITFRTIDNLLNGYGPRWNVTERVQTFTHPLWLLVLAPAVAAAGNPYLASLALSFVLLLATIALLVWSTRERAWSCALGLTLLVCSKAFMEYSSSGLENVLSHALLALLMTATRRPDGTRSRALRLGTLVAAIGLTRLDLLVLAGPIAAAALRVSASRRSILSFTLGLWPLAAWEAFSVFYYGVPFPNTAYAKLATAIERPELVHQGVVYLLQAANRDPVTLFGIGAALAASLRRGPRNAWPVGLALALYLTYLVSIGGDFMSGRFLSAPLVVSAFVLTALDWGERPIAQLAPLAVTLALGLSVRDPIVFSGAGYSKPLSQTALSATGITDERALYFQRTGLLSLSGWRTSPLVADLLPKIARAKESHPTAFVHGAVGLVGYYTGPDRHIVDPWALGDPLLARLPAVRPWQIGHYQRILPEGYFESVATGTNRIPDPAVHRLYERIREVTRGPLWSWRRMRAIVALNTGAIVD